MVVGRQARQGKLFMYVAHKCCVRVAIANIQHCSKLNDLNAYEIDLQYWAPQFMAGPQNIQPGYRAGHTANLM